MQERMRVLSDGEIRNIFNKAAEQVIEDLRRTVELKQPCTSMEVVIPITVDVFNKESVPSYTIHKDFIVLPK